MNLQNKKILITGVTSGIGESLAHKLAKEGANLILVAREEDILQSFVKEYGANHHYFVCDLTKVSDIEKLIEGLHGEEKLDALLNVAGVGIYKNLEDLTLDDWQTSYDLNVTAPFLLTQKLLSKLEKVEDSLVLTIGSGSGKIPMKGRSAYCSSKFALRGLVLCWAEEFAGRNPDFCLITLGSTITNFGGMTISQKEEAVKQGKAYFPLDFVTDKLLEIIKDDKRETEITLFPSDFGFGTWQKP